MLRKSYQIINIQETPPRQIFTNPKPGNSHHAIFTFKEGEAIPSTFLAPDPGKKLIFSNMMTKLTHDRITSGNLRIGFSDKNSHGCFVIAPQ